MNEKIKKLAIEAGYLPDSFGIGHWDMPVCHKFAELIVRECISAVEDTNDRHRRDYFAAKIKQHFEIE